MYARTMDDDDEIQGKQVFFTLNYNNYSGHGYNTSKNMHFCQN